MSTAIDQRPDAPAAEAVQREVGFLRRRRSVRPVAMVIALAIGLVGVFAIRVLLGTYTVAIPDFFSILAGHSI